MSAEGVPSERNDEQDVVPELTETVEPAMAEPAPEPSVGQRLRQAREARGWSVDHVAKMLKLSVHQVQSLEADDWERLPCNTILRGFVRNYARAMGLNAAELMAKLDEHRAPKTPELDVPQGTNVRVPQEGGVQRRDYFSAIAGVTALVLAVLVYFFLPDSLWQSLVGMVQTSSPSAVVATPAVSGDAASGQAVTIAPPAAIVLGSESQAVTPAATAATPTSASAAPVTASEPKTLAGNGLKMSFAKPSWVEIRDRGGEVIFSQLCPADSLREVDGKAPLSLVIGNAAHVTVTYKGKPIDLSKRSKDDVARVTVE